MKKILLAICLMSGALLASGQTFFEYDKKGNQIRRSRSAIPSPDIEVSQDTSIHKGNTVRLSAKGGEAYSWSNGEKSSFIEVRPDFTTRYYVSIIDQCKLEHNDSIKVEVMLPSKVDDPNLNIQFGVSPNPATIEAQLSIDLPRSGLCQIRLINAAGDVLSFFEFSAQSQHLQVPLVGYPAGQYFWSLWFEGSVITKPFAIVP